MLIITKCGIQIQEVWVMNKKFLWPPWFVFFSLDIFTVKHLWDQVQSNSVPILNYCERINMTNMQFLCFCQEDECIIPSYPNKEMKTWPISWDSSRLYNLIFTFHLIEEMNDRPILRQNNLMAAEESTDQ